MKRKLSKQFSTYLSLLILLLGQFWGLSSVKTFADTVDSKRYIGWTITTGETPASFDESIYVSPQGSHAGDLADAIVAYCFNYTYATPPKSDSTTNYPIYEKETGTAESFGQYATSKRITNEELYKAVLKVMYNGFPNNAASLQGAISDARFRAVTQYAVWHFTDNYDATTILSSDELELYNTLIGNKAGAKNVPEDATLDIYRNTMEVHASTAQGASKPEYQNLLSSRFVNKVTGEELKITPSIDIYAKKVWENANSIVKKPDVSFRLKNKATDAQVGEILTVSTSESTEESNVVKWENIPGKHSDYIVEEVSVPEGYTSSGRGSGKGTLENPFVITNKKQSDIPAYVQSISVTKVWKGEKADTSKRPDVYFTIFQVKNGIETILTADKLPTPKGFENPKKLTSLAPVTWRNLYAPGIDKDTNEPISYIVKETDKDGNVLTSPNYEVSSTVIGANTANHSYTFTNTFKEEKTNSKEIEISKVNLGGEELEGAKIRISKDGKEVESWTSTKTAKSLKLEAGEYVFHEISAPAGYKVVTDITFTVDKDGNVTVTNDTTTGTKTVVAGNKLVITDETITHSVEISKQNIAGENLASAKVTVTDKSGNVVTDVNGTKVEQFVTTKDNLKLQLPAGEYTFVEDAAPAGYDVVSTFKFTVDTNGTVTTTSTDAKTNGSVLTVVDQATKVVPKEFKVAISKVGLGGVELAGADVTVTKDGQEVDRWTSTTTSHELTLTEGTYVFHEISAPAGYKVVTDITFTVDKDGNVTVTNDTTTGTKTVVAGNKLVITDETTAHDVLFSKTDLGGSEIAGARIEIRDTENNLVTSWTSEAGVTKQVSLNEGAYTFNEVVAPAGFVKVTAITFTVSTDGQVYVVHSDQNKVTSSKNHLTVIDDAVAKPIETPKGSLTVQKVDATSNAVLQGAVFSVVGNITETTSTVDSSKVDATLAAKQEEIAQLQAKLAELAETAKATDPADAVAVEANRLAIENAQKALDAANNSYSALLIEKTNLKPTVTSKTVTKDFGTVTTDANGVASLTELPDGEYSITETKAPAGYDLDSKPHVVTIKDGQASVTSNTLVVTNSKTVIPTPQFDITIRKVDLAGSELAGAQIQVKQGDTVISEWTSTGQGQVVSLKPGTYTFHEVAAPNGYKVVTDITFSVDETGQVAILSARADEAKVAANELIVTDQKVQQLQETQPQTPKTNNNKFKGDDTSKGSSSATEVVDNSESNKVLPATNSTDLKGVVIAGFGFLIAGFVLAFFGKKKKA
ncbi:SpaA isopeptide-forming pilin-related protein [Streptococcus mitis]|uniref:Uncharacterized protein n=1 Tax=Streptococcus mitis TaxID=28037 RepID=A0A1X1K7H8_STRMT|nr:SpaA isopeptide-forming pilin-related protein [Streptococcus mitis]ORO95315.1 hypothetical protein B7698_04410 [Streptococcus mitis]